MQHEFIEFSCEIAFMLLLLEEKLALLLASSIGTASRSMSVVYLLQMAPSGHGRQSYGSSHHHLILPHCFGCGEASAKKYHG